MRWQKKQKNKLYTVADVMNIKMMPIFDAVWRTCCCDIICLRWPITTSKVSSVNIDWWPCVQCVTGCHRVTSVDSDQAHMLLTWVTLGVVRNHAWHYTKIKLSRSLVNALCASLMVFTGHRYFMNGKFLYIHTLDSPTMRKTHQQQDNRALFCLSIH